MGRMKLFVTAVTVGVLATSCVNGLEERKSGKDIRVTVSTNHGLAVKSAQGSWSIAEDSELNVADMKLTFSAEAALNEVNPFEPQTKGTVITSDNISETLGSFNMYIPEADKLQNVVVSTDGKDNWTVEPQSGVKAEWPENKHGENIDFFAYSGASLDRSNSQNVKLVYSGASTTASEMKDLLYSHVSAKENPVKINFYHALASVRFVVGNLKSDYTVKSLSVKNVYNSGTATYNEDIDFSWDVQGQTRTTLSQEFTGDNHTKLEYFDNEASSTFFVVPQSVEGVCFEVVITDNIGNEYPVEVRVPALEGGWKSGYYYTYSISGGDGTVSIDINETFKNNVKSDIKALNDGKIKVYVRAAVVANWCNSAGKIVNPWNGNMTLADDSKWVLLDGFYYYKSPLANNKLSDKLFTNDIQPVGAPDGTHLEVKVVMQAVECDETMQKVASAWGNEAKSVLDAPVSASK